MIAKSEILIATAEAQKDSPQNSFFQQVFTGTQTINLTGNISVLNVLLLTTKLQKN